MRSSELRVPRTTPRGHLPRRLGTGVWNCFPVASTLRCLVAEGGSSHGVLQCQGRGVLFAHLEGARHLTRRLRVRCRVIGEPGGSGRLSWTEPSPCAFLTRPPAPEGGRPLGGATGCSSFPLSQVPSPPTPRNMAPACCPSAKHRASAA